MGMLNNSHITRLQTMPDTYSHMKIGKGLFKKASVDSPPSPGARHALSRGKAASREEGEAYTRVR